MASQHSTATTKTEKTATATLAAGENGLAMAFTFPVCPVLKNITC